MNHHTRWLTMDDNHPIHIKSWLPNEEPKAIVQLAHGMVEHMNRYHEFAAFLTNHQIAVYGNDHRGHGQTGLAADQLGFLSTSNGFERITKDCITVTKWIKEKHPNIPILLIGHSMGSFVSRYYITKEPQLIQGVILIGTGFQPSALLTVGKTLAKTFGKLNGKQTKAPILNSITFFGYNKGTNHSTPMDWLCSDEKVTQQYIQDPLCGFIPTNQFFYDLYNGIQSIQSKKNAGSIPKDLPLLFLSGLDDPVGSYGKGVKKAFTFYQDIGLHNIDYKLYPNARHELLHEMDKEEIFQSILKWINKQIYCKIESNLI